MIDNKREDEIRASLACIPDPHSNPDFQTLVSDFRLVIAALDAARAENKQLKEDAADWKAAARRLLDERDQARTEIEAASKACGHFQQAMMNFAKERDQALARLRTATEALEYYSRQEIYQGENQKPEPGLPTRGNGSYLLGICSDGGSIAREALRSIKEGGE